MKEELKVFLIGCFVISFMIFIGIKGQNQAYYELNETCNEKFGTNHWILNETTGTGACVGYIGQCWTCVENITGDKLGKS